MYPQIFGGPTVAAPELKKQAGALAALTSLGAAVTGGKGGGMGGLANLPAVFGIGGPGGTQFANVLGSKGVAGLAAIAGTALLSQGLQKRFAPATILGGTLMGLPLARQIPGMDPLTGLVAGAGLGTFAAGVQRGGGVGLAMDVGGGALAGAAIGSVVPGVGTLIGAGIGAAVGAIAGVVRLFVKTEQEKIRAQIKQVYGIDIPNRQILTQIQQIVDQNYGGNVAVGIRSQEVQNLVRLYALSTGQAANMPRPMYNATIAEANGQLALQPVYQGGVQVRNPYTGPTTYQYQTAVTAAQGLMPNPGSGLGVPGGQGAVNAGFNWLTFQQYNAGQVVGVLQQNPSAVAMSNATAAQAGDSRLTTTAAMQEPLTALG